MRSKTNCSENYAFFNEIKFMKNVIDLRQVKKSNSSCQWSLSQEKDKGTKLALARKNICMLNAANLIKKTGSQTG